MSEQENLEVVQRGYKAFTEGDIPTLRNLLADDVEWNFHPTYVGIP
jgi:ketosteroid isomerase-like protein